MSKISKSRYSILKSNLAYGNLSFSIIYLLQTDIFHEILFCYCWCPFNISFYFKMSIFLKSTFSEGGGSVVLIGLPRTRLPGSRPQLENRALLSETRLNSNPKKPGDHIASILKYMLYLLIISFNFKRNCIVFSLENQRINKNSTI